jgi:hypothetical protein
MEQSRFGWCGGCDGGGKTRQIGCRPEVGMEGGLEEGVEARRRATAGADGRRGGGDRDGGRQRARMGGEAVETATAGDGVRGWEARWRRPRRRATASADGRRGGGDRNGGRQRPRMGGEAVETATAGDSVRGWEARRGREVTGDALWKVVGGSDMQVDARRA